MAFEGRRTNGSWVAPRLSLCTYKSQRPLGHSSHFHLTASVCDAQRQYCTIDCCRTSLRSRVRWESGSRRQFASLPIHFDGVRHKYTVVPGDSAALLQRLCNWTVGNWGVLKFQLNSVKFRFNCSSAVKWGRQVLRAKEEAD